MPFPFNKHTFSNEVFELRWPAIWSLYIFSIPALLIFLLFIYTPNEESVVKTLVGLILLLFVLAIAKTLRNLKKEYLQFRFSKNGFETENSILNQTYHFNWNEIHSLHIGDTYLQTNKPFLVCLSNEVLDKNGFSIPKLFRRNDRTHSIIKFNYSSIDKSTFIEMIEAHCPNEKLEKFTDTPNLP